MGTVKTYRPGEMSIRDESTASCCHVIESDSVKQRETLPDVICNAQLEEMFKVNSVSLLKKKTLIAVYFPRKYHFLASPITFIK